MDKFKTITGIGIVGLVALIAFLFWRVDKLKDEKLAETQRVYDLEWQIVSRDAVKDTIWGVGQYLPPETTWVTQVNPTDTVSIPERIPIIHGVISIDTTRQFGPAANPLSVHVSGQIHYPEEYSHKNWLTIVPTWGKPPQMPQDRRSGLGLTIGLVFLTSTHQGDGIGAGGGFVTYKRFTVAGLRDIQGKTWHFAVGVGVLSF